MARAVKEMLAWREFCHYLCLVFVGVEPFGFRYSGHFVSRFYVAF